MTYRIAGVVTKIETTKKECFVTITVDAEFAISYKKLKYIVFLPVTAGLGGVVYEGESVVVKYKLSSKVYKDWRVDRHYELEIQNVDKSLCIEAGSINSVIED